MQENNQVLQRMTRNKIKDFVEQFGALMNKPDNCIEVEQLMLSIPDPNTFEQIRNLFYVKYNIPFLPSFLGKLSPDQHVRILNAYKRATKDYH